MRHLSIKGLQLQLKATVCIDLVIRNHVHGSGFYIYMVTFPRTSSCSWVWLRPNNFLFSTVQQSDLKKKLFCWWEQTRQEFPAILLRSSPWDGIGLAAVPESVGQITAGLETPSNIHESQVLLKTLKHLNSDTSISNFPQLFFFFSVMKLESKRDIFHMYSCMLHFMLWTRQWRMSLL